MSACERAEPLRDRATAWRWDAAHALSSQAPALASVLLGDVEGDGAGGGVALSPAAVTAVLGGLGAAMTRPSSSGSFIWSARCPGPCFVFFPRVGALCPPY